MGKAFSVVADLVRPAAKRKFQDSDSSISSEVTVVKEEEDLITFDYQHFNADSPSTKSGNGHDMNLANLQFNTLNVIGMSYSTFFPINSTHSFKHVVYLTNSICLDYRSTLLEVWLHRTRSFCHFLNPFLEKLYQI